MKRKIEYKFDSYNAWKYGVFGKEYTWFLKESIDTKAKSYGHWKYLIIIHREEYE